MNIATFYKTMESEREPYIDYADQIAQLIHPTINPRGRESSGGTVAGSNAGDRAMIPNSHKGTQALSSLSSTVVKTMMPNGVKYGHLEFPEAVWSQLDADATAVVKDRLQRRSAAMIRSLEQKNAGPLMISAIERNLVEGSTAVVNHEDGLQFYPLRSHVVYRLSGMEQTFLLKEEVDPDPTETNETSRQMKYTMVRRPNKRLGKDGGVWVQDDGSENAKQAEMNPAQAFIMVGSIPDIDNYPVSYTYRFYRLFQRIDHAEGRLGDAMSIASFNIPLIRPGSYLAKNQEKLDELKSGQPLIADPNDLSWFNSEMKMQDWQFVAQLLNHYYQGVSEAFAMGIKDRQIGADTSATAVLQMIDELNTQTQGLLTAIEHTGIRQLLWSEFWLQEARSPLFADLIEDQVKYAQMLDLLEMVITTGASATERQRSLLRFALQLLPSLLQMDKTLVVHGAKIADKFADSMMIDMEGTYEQASPEAMTAMQEGGIDSTGAAQQGSPSASSAPESGEAMMTRGGPQRTDNPQPSTGS